ncbi:protein YnhH [Dryocola sp. BD613]|uniref:protein YnhH n=1 Tax=Dryocola sp. BD613 TaxID=3133272 RepID=UPI003F4F800D
MDSLYNRQLCPFPRLAEPQAYFPLHALSLSPILTRCHLYTTSFNFRSGGCVSRNRVLTILLNLQIRLS